MSQKPLSPEKYIRTKARSLPLYTCLLNSDWKETGLALVTVTRKHPKGTITAGIFLVDILCLGVKDCFYIFSENEEELWDKVESGYISDILEVDYLLAHNIIFNSIDFAQSFGINPCKDFNHCQYLLEPEDSIEYLETPVGDDEENPIFCTTRGDSQNLSIINKLVNHFGKDGFKVVYKDDHEDLEDFGDDDFSNEEEFSYTPEEVFQISERFSKHCIYSKEFQTKVDKLSEFINEINMDSSKPCLELPDEISNKIDNLYSNGYSNNIFISDGFQDLISQYPQNEELHLILLDYYYFRLSQGDAVLTESLKFCEEILNKFPDSVTSRIEVGEFYIDNEMHEDFEKIWGRSFSIESSLSMFDKYDSEEVSEIANLFISYYLFYNKIEHAEIIFQAFREKEFYEDFIPIALEWILNFKEDYLEELNVEY